MPIVVDRDDDSYLRLRLVRLLGMYPVHLWPGLYDTNDRGIRRMLP
jgi:hypothetical protein